MKIIMKRSFAIVMTLVMCASMFFGLSFSAQAETENAVNYVYAGNYVYNWGTREEEATFLSPMAEEFYSTNGVVLSELLALSGSSTESNIPSSALYSALQTLMVDNHDNTTSYDGTRDLYKYTDCQNSGSPSTISCFYSGAAIGPEWDSGSTWNREHTWPNSKGITDGDHENDIMMLRPTSSNVNSSRGNKAYGTTTTTEYYNPNQEGGGDVRGDVARIILYQYVRWGLTNTGTEYNPDSIFGADGVIESQEVLLTWMEEDPVDTWELGRNDAVEAITGTRNVFVDYPELAFDLFNEAIPTGYTSPSGGADVEGSTGGDSTDDTTDDTTTDGNYYVKVTEAPTDWSGDYLIVYEDGNVALNGGLSSLDVTSNTISVTIQDGKIASDATTDAAVFTIAKSGSYYTIKSKSGFYIGHSGTSNKLTNSATTAYNNTLSVSGENTVITAEDSYVLRYNTDSGQTRFRYYKNTSSYPQVALYKLTTVDDGSGDGGDSGDSGDSGDGGDSGDTTQTTEVNATITFDDTGLVATETSTQVWSENGVTVTNNKGSSTSAFYTTVTDHTRFYKGNQIVIEYEYPISKIVFTTTGSSYTTTLANSLTSSGLGTVTSSGTTITLELTTPSETVTFDHVNTATRVKSMDITALKTTGGDSGDTTSPVITATTNNGSYGSVEVSGKYITATPATGYEVSGYEITSGSATVTQNGNVFTVEATSDVTVQINFAARTQYTVTFKEMGTTTSTQNAYNGDSITLPTIASDDYTVVGWVAAEIDGETTDKPTVYNAGSVYTVTANTTFYALYSRTEAGGSGESTTFTKWTEAVTEGDYIIVGAHSSSTATPYGAMNTSKNNSKNRLDYTEVTVTNDTITTEDATIIWHISSSSDGYWTIYNEAAAGYAAGNGTKSLAVLITSVTDYAKWNITGTSSHVFENVGNKNAGVNYTLRRNGTSGYACYAASTGTAPVLYKRTVAAMTTYYFTSAGETPDYTVTANANDDSFGTVTVSGTTISATPNAGYTVSGYSIESGTATVTQEGNTFFVTPSSNVTITINFEALPTYTVTFVENGAQVGTESTYSGGFIKLPEYSGELDEYTTFDGWAEAENETDAAKIYAAKANYAVTKDVTLYAQFTVTEPPVVEESDHYFVKVTEDQTDWTGTYLIVYEAGSIAFNSAITDKLDVASNGVGVTIAGGKIAATTENIAVSFVVEKTEGGYTIRSKSGLYFGSESDTNSLLSNATKTYFNNFAIDADGNTTVTGEGGAILRYNATSGQDRFRFYKTSSYAGQQPIALYKLDVADITGAQVTVGADLNVNYYVDTTNIENVAVGDLTMRFTIGEDAPVTVNGQIVDGQYVFEFAGITPQRMGDIIKSEVLYKGNLVDVLDEYSVKQNALNLLDNDPENAKLKQFITDMLYYGAAAQKYTGYKKTELVTAGIEDVLGTPNSNPLTNDDNKLNLTQPTGDVRFKSATVWFDAVNKLIVKANNPNGDAIKVYVTPSGETRTELAYNSEVGGYMTDGIKVIDFGTIYTFELCDADNNVMQTLTYSVNTYAYAKQSSSNLAMVELALALFRLGQSAESL